jgi:CubicO group peptidase (beta-lactamase class C family)
MPVLQSVPPTVALPTQPPDVAWPTIAWPEAEAPPELAELLDAAFVDEPNTDESGPLGQSLAVVAVQSGHLVAERYGPTASVDEPLITWSMAKSITQALVGLVVADGALDINDPAPIAQWTDGADPRNVITVDHLLRMVPGTEFIEAYIEGESSHCLEMLFGAGAADMAGYVAELPALAPPNTVFNYSSGTTNLLTRIVGDIVGDSEDFDAWMQRRLLNPIGMPARLTFDDRGTWIGSSFLHTSARDFAKFGLLYLRDGMWDGERLLPEGWVDYARTLQATDDDGVGYGAHWWIWGPDNNVFYAAGYETQRIIVDPARDLVLVRLGKTATDKADAVDAWLEQVRLTFPLAPTRRP